MLLFSLLALLLHVLQYGEASIPNRCGNDAALIIYVRKVQGLSPFPFAPPQKKGMLLITDYICSANMLVIYPIDHTKYSGLNCNEGEEEYCYCKMR